MGAVYLATQELLNRRIAIKLLHMSSDEVTAARFQRERASSRSASTRTS
ncbi:MAG: hypothetical protein U1F43_27205 [Myxococcota bacterium]